MRVILSSENRDDHHALAGFWKVLFGGEINAEWNWGLSKNKRHRVDKRRLQVRTYAKSDRHRVRYRRQSVWVPRRAGWAWGLLGRRRWVGCSGPAAGPSTSGTRVSTPASERPSDRGSSTHWRTGGVFRRTRPAWTFSEQIRYERLLATISLQILCWLHPWVRHHYAPWMLEDPEKIFFRSPSYKYYCMSADVQ